MLLTGSPEARLDDALRSLGVDVGRETVVVAVSGGGDSMALFALMSELWRERPPNLRCVSVDHGLRAESAAECESVREFAEARSHPHATLRWECDGRVAGNLQSEARKARYRLIADWARSERVRTAALAHTLDDQAETLLLNLARGSGVDGLSAMPRRLRRNGIDWIRPLLGFRRSELRECLTEREVRWAEDPANSDARYDRVKARRMLDHLKTLGATRERLAATADRMAHARSALERSASAAAERIAEVSAAGDVELGPGIWELPEELKLRLAAAALRFRSGADYRPRIDALKRCLANVVDGDASTLSGCMMSRMDGGGIRVARERAACPPPVQPGEVWDGRWAISGKKPPGGAVLGALGSEGLAECPDWRGTGLPARSLECAPALWHDGVLVAAPIAGLSRGWAAELLKGRRDFLDSFSPD